MNKIGVEKRVNAVIRKLEMERDMREVYGGRRGGIDRCITWMRRALRNALAQQDVEWLTRLFDIARIVETELGL